MFYYFFCVFVLRSNTEYDMRISDVSADVCSSDRAVRHGEAIAARGVEKGAIGGAEHGGLGAEIDVAKIDMRALVHSHQRRRHRDIDIFARAGLGAAMERGEDRDHRLKPRIDVGVRERSEEHTSELQSLMRISYAVFCLKKKKNTH